MTSGAVAFGHRALVVALAVAAAVATTALPGAAHAAAGAVPNCPANTIVTDTKACALVNGTVPPRAVEKAIQTIAAARAKRAGWRVTCLELGPAGQTFEYECELYTVDPAGTVSIAVGGHTVKVDLRASYQVKHNGCVYAVQNAVLAIIPTIVPNGCGAAGLRRIEAALK